MLDILRLISQRNWAEFTSSLHGQFVGCKKFDAVSVKIDYTHRNSSLKTVYIPLTPLTKSSIFHKNLKAFDGI